MTENRKPMPLLPEAKPDNQYPEQETILPNGLPVVRNVTFPTLTPFLPADVRTGMPGMIVAPGGAMHFLAHAHEGTQVCEWLNQRGIPAFLLKYRLIKTGDDFPECVDRNMAEARFSRL